MSTKIEWCDETWNPIKMRCTPVSEGCKNCYAQRLLGRKLPGFDSYPTNREGPILATVSTLNKPMHYRGPKRIFVQSMGDLFHDDVPDFMLNRVFDRILYDGISDHTFMLLTKRVVRMAEYIIDITKRGFGLPDNVWLGVTAENQRTADERIPILLQIPAVVRFVSVEPMLGPVDLIDYLPDPLDGNVHLQDYGDLPPLDWCICGAETGPGKRYMKPEWAFDLKRQCIDANVPFFFKKFSKMDQQKTWIDAMPREFPNQE